MPKNPTLNSPFFYNGIMPAFDKDSFEAFIASNGIELVHYKAIPCPVGQADDQDTVHKAHVNHPNCSNGYIYIKAGNLVATFNNNPNMYNLDDVGLVSGSTVMVTFPYAYNDGTVLLVAVQDKLYLANPQGYVTSQQRFTRGEGVTDFLNYAPEYIEYIFDSTGKQYQPTDYTVANGALLWVGDRPAAGTVCSTRYQYLPYWRCQKLLHEIRIANVIDPVTGDRSVTRMPYAALCNRENYSRNQFVDINPNQIITPKTVLPASLTNNNLLSNSKPSVITGTEENEG